MAKNKTPFTFWVGEKAFGVGKKIAGLSIEIIDETLYAGLNSVPGNSELKSNADIARETEQYKRLMGRR